MKRKSVCILILKMTPPKSVGVYYSKSMEKSRKKRLGDQLGKVGKRIHGTALAVPKLREQVPGSLCVHESHQKLKWVAKKHWMQRISYLFCKIFQSSDFHLVFIEKNGKHTAFLCYLLLLALDRQYKTSVETLKPYFD